jgi:hypothetical protein
MGATIGLWPPEASADTGIPILAAFWPSSSFAFVPIVLVEAWVAHRVLHAPPGRCIRLSLTANAWSTFVGVPIGLVVLALLRVIAGAVFESVRAGQDGILPLGLSHPAVAWIITASGIWGPILAFIVLCGGSFALSVWIEAAAAREYFSLSHEQAAAWARAANLVSYGLGLLLVAILVAVERH